MARDLFEALDELAHVTKSHGVSLVVCSARFARKNEGPNSRGYLREVRNLWRAVADEARHNAEQSIAAERSTDPHSIEGDAFDVAIYAGALEAIGDELERLAIGLSPEEWEARS